MLTTWNQALENYLVNEFFMRFYPFAHIDSLTVNARIFVMTWKIVEFGLLMLNIQQPIDLERLILGINRMTDRLDHSRKVTQAIQGTVKSLHLNTAQYARLLLGK